MFLSGFFWGMVAGSLVTQLIIYVAMRRHRAKAGTPSASHNSGSPKCYCCGSENVIIECGSCKDRRVFGTWSSQ